jgi:glutamine synthetase
VEHELELPPPQPPGEDPNTEIRIPPNLDAALDALAADKELVSAVGAELVDAFTILKRAEWERYVASGVDPSTTDVTPWEIEYYRPFH